MTTKFDPNQEVYVVDGENLITGTIDFITIEPNSSIAYFIRDLEEEFHEDNIFADKIDAVNQWLDINDIELDVELTNVSIEATLKQL